MVEGQTALGRDDRFELVRKLGRGGMGTVFEAFDREREQRVALKTLDRADGEALYRFKTEFRSLADISHPNLVTLFDLFVDDAGSFFTMELIDGLDFVTHCRGGNRADAPPTTGERSEWEADTAQMSEGALTGGGPPCDVDRTRGALQQLAGGLAALHAAGWIHRDVKASNVLVDRRGRVVVLDFGLATDLGGGSVDGPAAQLLGTVEYMSPEQAFPLGPLTAATDWYSVGVMLYEILTGRLPFEGKLPRILSEKRTRDPAPPRELAPTAPDDLSELSTSLLARDPSRRPRGPEVLRRLGVTSIPGERSGSYRVRAADKAPFSGRVAELSSLTDALAAVHAGGPRAVVLRGPSGVGKTELVREFIAHAEQLYPDAAVLRGRCYEREAVPFRAIDPLVDDLSRLWNDLGEPGSEQLVPRSAAELVRLFPVLARVPALIGARLRLAIADPQEVKKRGLEGLRETLFRLGEQRTLIVFLDDLQWVDRDTGALLEQVMRAPGAPRLLLILASREDDDSGPAEALDDLIESLEMPVADHRLGPLPRDEATALAERLLPPGKRQLAGQIAHESGGLPLFVVELSEYAQLEDPNRRREGPVKLETVLAERLDALREEPRNLVELVAVAREPIAQRTAAAACKLEMEELRRELHALRVARLVRTSGGRADDLVEPYHDRVRAAAIAEMTRGQLAQRHGRLAVALEKESEPPNQRLALHWLGAGRPDRAKVYQLLAAREAFDQLDFDRAAELYESVLELGELDDDERRHVQAVVAAALTNAGRPREAAAAFRLAAEGANAADRLDLERRAAEQLLRGGYLEEGMAEMQRVLDRIGLRLPRSRLGAALRVLWGRMRLRLRNLDVELRDESQISREEATRVDVCWSVGSSLAIVDPLIGASFHVRGLELALRLRERRRLARALALQSMFYSAEHKAARSKALVSKAQELGGPDLYVAGYTLLAEAAHCFFAANDWARALERAEELSGIFHAEFASAGWELDSAQIYACFSLMYQGRMVELRRTTARAVADADRRAARYASVNYRVRLGLAHLAAGDDDRAERELEEAIASWAPPDAGFQVQHFYALHGRCEIALYRGDADRAAELLADGLPAVKRSMITRVPLVAAEVDQLAARIALARARTGARSELSVARKLARRLARNPVPLAGPFGQLVAAGAAMIGGDEDRAGELLRAAIRELDVLDTNLYAAAARRRLAELTGDDEVRERADAWLAAEEVAAPDRLVALLVPA